MKIQRRKVSRNSRNKSYDLRKLISMTCYHWPTEIIVIWNIRSQGHSAGLASLSTDIGIHNYIKQTYNISCVCSHTIAHGDRWMMCCIVCVGFHNPFMHGTQNTFMRQSRYSVFLSWRSLCVYTYTSCLQSIGYVINRMCVHRSVIKDDDWLITFSKGHKRKGIEENICAQCN